MHLSDSEMTPKGFRGLCFGDSQMAPRRPTRARKGIGIKSRRTTSRQLIGGDRAAR